MAAGATSRHISRELGFSSETAEPPAWKGANDENVQFFVRACIQAYGFRLFVLSNK